MGIPVNDLRPRAIGGSQGAPNLCEEDGVTKVVFAARSAWELVPSF